MTDPLSLRQCAFTFAVAKLILKAQELGYQCKVQEWNRELATQEKYVASGASKTLDSRHIDKLAVDLVLFKDGICIPDGESYRSLGVFWESIGGRWGGRFGLEKLSKAEQDVKLGWDSNHFEYRRA